MTFFFGTSLRTKEALAAKDVRALDLRPVTDLGAPNIGIASVFPVQNACALTPLLGSLATKKMCITEVMEAPTRGWIFIFFSEYN